MAKSSLIENAEITEVYYKIGTYNNDQRPKFIKAPFDIVTIGTEQYIQPLPVGGNAEDLSGAFNSDTVNVEQLMGRRDFGFPNLNPVVVGEHELGSVENKSDWKGVHSFDMI